MLVVEPKEGEPRLKLYESLDELQRETGEAFTHGYFDPSTNTIVATLDSCAHELGHWKDFKSGRMKIIAGETSSEIRAQARMRNEIVAILYAAQKVKPGPSLLEYEKAFWDWFVFMKSKKVFSNRPFENWSLSDIQDFAEWVVGLEHEWFERLEFIFRHYLQDAHITLTYSKRAGR